METVLLDDFLDEGIIREKSFRRQVDELELDQYKNKKVIAWIPNAVKPAIVAKTTNPKLSSSPPTQKIIGNASNAMRFVPVCAPSILKPVKFVLS